MDDLADLLSTYHSRRPQHLPQCVRKIEDSLFGSPLNILNHFAKGILQTGRCQSAAA
jgi:hypothetical protein